MKKSVAAFKKVVFLHLVSIMSFSIATVKSFIVQGIGFNDVIH